MRHIQYAKLEQVVEEHPHELNNIKSSIWSTKSLLFILFLMVLSVAFVYYFNGNLRVQSRGKPLIIQKLANSFKQRRNITSFQDYYFTKEESQYLKCPELINGSQDAINEYVTFGRIRLDKEKLLDLSMDCFLIRKRLFGDLSPFKQLKKSLLFVRNIYGLYELQEVFLSMSYHPNHFYCYAIDSKSSEKLKKSMRTLAKCFDNVLVLDKEYLMDRAGHNQDRAHFDCMERFLHKDWSHVITLQNFDLIIKTPEQLSELSEILNSTSIMGSDYGLTDRYDSNADWTPAGMKLFKDESKVPKDILHKKLVIRKSLNQVILSKVFVKSLYENVNLDKIIDRFDNPNLFGIDEMMVMTLYENYLGLEGQMESNCTEEQEDRLTRHSMCLFGVEYLQEIAESPMIIANKVVESFDFGTIICTREMMKRNKTGSIPTAEWLSERFPQFKEMQMNISGTYDKKNFHC